MYHLVAFGNLFKYHKTISHRILRENSSDKDHFFLQLGNVENKLHFKFILED